MNLNVKTILYNLPLVEGSEATYPFLKIVSERFIEHSNLHAITSSQLQRFALVLLYVDYRAANSQLGSRDGFTTLSPVNSYQKKRFDFFNSHFEPVKSTTEYCSLLGIGITKSLFRGLLGKSMEGYLFRYIIGDQ